MCRQLEFRRNVDEVLPPVRAVGGQRPVIERSLFPDGEVAILKRKIRER